MNQLVIFLVKQLAIFLLLVSSVVFCIGVILFFKDSMTVGMSASDHGYAIEAISVQITILGITVTVAGIFLAVLGFFGYSQIKKSAEDVARKIAKDTTKRIAKDVARSIAKDVAKRVAEERMDLFKQQETRKKETLDDKTGEAPNNEQPTNIEPTEEER